MECDRQVVSRNNTLTLQWDILLTITTSLIISESKTKGRNTINKNEDTHTPSKTLCKWTVDDASLLLDFTLIENNAMIIDWWVQCFTHHTQRIQRPDGELTDTKGVNIPEFHHHSAFDPRLNMTHTE